MELATDNNNNEYSAPKDSVGERIRAQRRKQNLSQVYMSYMLDISQAAYSNIETDKAELTINRLYEIADIFKISPFELMPPSKYGSGINLGKYLRTLFKYPRRNNAKINARHEEAVKLKIVYRDKSKNLD